MDDSRVKAVKSRMDALAGSRGTWETHWRELSELMSPMRDDFNIQRVPGEKRMTKVFDSSPLVAANNLAAGLWGMMTNSANKWFGIQCADQQLNQWRPVKLWCYQVTEIMLSEFAANGMRFYSKAADMFGDLAILGTGVFYTDEYAEKNSLFFSCRHLAECFIAQNNREEVDTLYRKYYQSARNIVQMFPETAGPKVRQAAEKNPDEQFCVIHAVMPTADYPGTLPRAPGAEFKFASIYIAEADEGVLDQRGYYEFPYQVPRWSQASRSVYGDSPGMLVLPDVKMLNQMSRTGLVAAQKQADPPLLAPHQSVVTGIRTVPGGVIYGGVDAQGRPLYHPLQSGANLQINIELEAQRRAAIKEGFHASLLMLVQQPGRTATEVLALQEEKLRLIGPHLGRVQSEYLDQLIERAFAVLVRMGKIPPPPEELKGQELKVHYVSPMARIQKSSEAVAVGRTLELIMPMAQADPTVLFNYDLDAMAQTVGEANGLPPTHLRDPREVKKMKDTHQQQQQAMAMAAAAPGVAKAAKDGAEASKVMQGAE